MAYNVYKGDELIAEKINEKEYTVEGLTPDTEYSFSISEIIGDEESEKSTITVKTKPINVTGVELSPKNMTAVAGTAANRQLTSTVAPENATNKAITYSVDPETTGLTVNASGVLAWTDAVSAGEYTVTVKTTDGNKTATSKLTLSEPEPEPEITTETETEEIDVVEFDTIRNETEELPKGEEETVQEGVNGYTKVTYEVTYEDGVEIERKEIDREVIDPVNKIINVGTYEEPDPDPEEGD